MEDFEQDISRFVGSEWLGTLITAVLILTLTAVVGHLLTKFLRKVLNYSDELPSSSIFINIGRAIVWVVGGSVMLSTCFGIDVSAAITALGIGGIAISLGFQDTISNLIGGVQVSLLRIVTPGDNISIGGSKGVVKDVSWRHTRNGGHPELRHQQEFADALAANGQGSADAGGGRQRRRS